MADKSTDSEAFLANPDIHESWETDYLNPELERFYSAAFARMLATLGASPGDRILDAGCGYCYHAGRLARAGLEVTGVDFSPAALEAARENLNRNGLTVDLREGNLLALDFADGSFPFIVCWGVLMHVPELEKALSELARVLAPGGRLALSENNRASWHVTLWEPFLINVKRLLGVPVPRRDTTIHGLEEWRAEGLLIRKLDMEWLVSFMSHNDMQLVERFSGQFTEIYTSMPGKALKQLVYRFNQFWFSRNGAPGRALSNIVVFEKAR